MKTLILTLTLTLSTSAFANQYIQCSLLDTEDTTVAVVNLETEKGGTLFISSGMQNPEDERLVVKIAFDSVQGKNHVYKVVDENGQGSVAVPSDLIGKSSNDLTVELVFNGMNIEFSCFSRIYND